jgi:propanol-preferring alcohol dehydrogenase
MKVMQLDRPGQPLRMIERPVPTPGPGEVRVRVAACAVCRTDLHVVDGELPEPVLPIVPGHEIVGRIEAVGQGVPATRRGERVGIPWLGWTCGRCEFCVSGQENLCDRARFTGYQIDGGYAEETIADARYCFPIPDAYDDAAAAPLLCAGLIGHRCLRMAGEARHLGLYGFGAAAHIVCQVARSQGREVYAFVRPGDRTAAAFAGSLGACWVGSSDQAPPRPLDAAIVFAPVGGLVPLALRAVRKAGVVVLGGIHMSDIPSFPYRILWEERVLRSVANLTRDDARSFLDLAPGVPVETTIQRFPLSAANEALDRLRGGRLEGAAVLIPQGG